jgi:hypothetical protein
MWKKTRTDGRGCYIGTSLYIFYSISLCIIYTDISIIISSSEISCMGIHKISSIWLHYIAEEIITTMSGASPETVALQMPSSSGESEGLRQSSSTSGDASSRQTSSRPGGSFTSDRTNKESVTKKPSVTIREPPRSQRSYNSGYTIVKIEEKHGPLHRAIPCMPLPLAVLCCMLNIVAPGIGKYLWSAARLLL